MLLSIERVYDSPYPINRNYNGFTMDMDWAWLLLLNDCGSDGEAFTYRVRELSLYLARLPLLTDGMAGGTCLPRFSSGIFGLANLTGKDCLGILQLMEICLDVVTLDISALLGVKRRAQNSQANPMPLSNGLFQSDRLFKVSRCVVLGVSSLARQAVRLNMSLN